MESWMHCLSQCCMCLKIAVDQPQRCQYVMGRNPRFSKPPAWVWIKPIERVLCPTQAMNLELGKCYMTWVLIIWGSSSSTASQETQRNWPASGKWTVSIASCRLSETSFRLACVLNKSRSLYFPKVWHYPTLGGKDSYPKLSHFQCWRHVQV